MAMTPREVVLRTVRFQGADRLPYDLAEAFGSDFYNVWMEPSPDDRPRVGVDEWGSVWHNIGVSHLGQVKEPALKDWADWPKLAVPDIRDPERWRNVAGARTRAGDRFLLAGGISLYERIHFLRGLDNAWVDIHTHRAELERLIDLLVDMNLYAIERFAAAGADGYMWADDWGLQDRLMISPASWRAIWKPAYARVYRAARDAGLLTFLHSCGNITAILEDLIEIGLDVIQMDQQENMGLERLGREFGGRITFWCPADIQGTMVEGSVDDIRAYCRKLVSTLGRPDGGFIARWYSDPAAAGHRQEAVEAMCQEFLRLGQQWQTADAAGNRQM